ncbi:ankyrin repeat domain-containing protein [Pedobacter aquae]|uniref:Ankyrin repeat domain-containing protein n=1 Tax=Pedobacter aquae TaxID=2605747 RepID=A0A5C0VF04_9SPHI|nr:ankyrin repeat domain-containing protein [Pedobacter aquae]QEK50667.1 ankyrin repeat domain-containing protein [Pedobacter aquae]
MQHYSLEDLIVKGNVEEIKAYLQQSPHALKEETSLGVSPLMLACYYKKNNIIKLFLEFSEDISFFEACSADKFDTVAHKIFQNPHVVNDFSEDGFTALGLACYFGNEEIARYLVLKGADVNLPANNPFKVFPLHSATAGNFTNICRMLIENGAAVNVVQQSGITPLHSAAQNGNIELIIMLLEKGAIVDVRMEGGKLPADLAKEKGFSEIAEILEV